MLALLQLNFEIFEGPTNLLFLQFMNLIQSITQDLQYNLQDFLKEYAAYYNLNLKKKIVIFCSSRTSKGLKRI